MNTKVGLLHETRLMLSGEYGQYSLKGRRARRISAFETVATDINRACASKVIWSSGSDPLVHVHLLDTRTLIRLLALLLRLFLRLLLRRLGPTLRLRLGLWPVHDGSRRVDDIFATLVHLGGRDHRLDVLFAFGLTREVVVEPLLSRGALLDL